MIVKPKPGLIVRDPDTRQPLPPEGREVPASTWWMRRLKSGDVVLVPSPPPPPAPEPAKSIPGKAPRRSDADEVKS